MGHGHELGPYVPMPLCPYVPMSLCADRIQCARGAAQTGLNVRLDGQASQSRQPRRFSASGGDVGPHGRETMRRPVGHPPPPARRRIEKRTTAREDALMKRRGCRHRGSRRTEDPPALRASGARATRTHAVSLPAMTRCRRSHVVNGSARSACSGTSPTSSATTPKPPADNTRFSALIARLTTRARSPSSPRIHNSRSSSTPAAAADGGSKRSSASTSADQLAASGRFRQAGGKQRRAARRNGAHDLGNLSTGIPPAGLVECRDAGGATRSDSDAGGGKAAVSVVSSLRSRNSVSRVARAVASAMKPPMIRFIFASSLSSRQGPPAFAQASFSFRASPDYILALEDARPVRAACGIGTRAGNHESAQRLTLVSGGASTGASRLLTENGQVVPDRSSFTEGSPRARSVLGESGPERFLFLRLTPCSLAKG